MEKKIVYRESFDPYNDGWGLHMKEIAIDKEENLYVRCSEGGNCEYGKWEEWEKNKKSAIKLVFNTFEPSKKLVKTLIEDFVKMEGLKEIDSETAKEGDYYD